MEMLNITLAQTGSKIIGTIIVALILLIILFVAKKYIKK